MDLWDVRREYRQTGLRRADLDPDPLRQFETWFAAAEAAGIGDPSACSLATADADGQPSVRTVLLKFVDADGFVFFTSHESDKARELAENPKAALLFAWLPLDRQIVVRGDATRLDPARAAAYFRTRPRGSQLSATVSPQSGVVPSRAWLDEALAKADAVHAGTEVPMPDTWGGYVVRPVTLEFWQGRVNRLHDRFRYVRADAAWDLARLGP